MVVHLIDIAASCIMFMNRGNSYTRRHRLHYAH